MHPSPSCHCLSQYNGSTSLEWNFKRSVSWILIVNCRMIFVWCVHQVNQEKFALLLTEQVHWCKTYTSKLSVRTGKERNFTTNDISSCELFIEIEQHSGSTYLWSVYLLFDSIFQSLCFLSGHFWKRVAAINKAADPRVSVA
jgi:hypothetical protein